VLAKPRGCFWKSRARRQPHAYTVNEDGTLTIAARGVLANDSDPDGNALTASLKGVSNGTATLNANGSFSFTPAANLNGIATIEYYALDGTAQSDLGFVTITVNAVNDVPSFSMRTDVSVALSSTNGTIAHGSVRVNSGQIGGGSAYASYYNSLPVVAPFQSATGAGGRFATYPGSGSSPFFIYARLDGAGAFSFTQTGTTLGVPSGNGTFTDPGTYLPTAAHIGTLASPLFLPSGTVLAGGTTIYSDYADLRVDLNDPASYWLDSATGTEHRTYRAGRWSFFYQNAGTFVKFAEYADVTQSFLINFGTGAVTGTWTATPLPIAGFSLPATGSSSVAEAINTTGILDNEKVSPFTGFYGRFPNSLQITFDVEGVTVAEDAGPQTVASWTTNISQGPANESGQTLEFLVTNTNNALFAVQPAIAANGTLTFTPAADAHGAATVTVRLKDNGGTANGGVDTSAAQTFTITVTPVNDAPLANNDFAVTRALQRNSGIRPSMRLLQTWTALPARALAR
jgi:hypothetical protein